LCEVELFRNRGTAHQSLPSNFGKKLLAKVSFPVTAVPTETFKKVSFEIISYSDLDR
jgi:hypothetical protein